jgi:hypothetical protein
MKHIFGTVTIVVIIGGTVYAIKKSKDLKKQEENEITLEEAEAIVKEREANEAYSESHQNASAEGVHFVVDIDDVTEVEPLGEEEMYILKEGVREAASFNRSNMMEEDFVDETVEGPSIDEDEENDYEIGKFTEEDRVLRYEPSSMDALKQYKRMELAELENNSDVYQTMLRLYDFPFQPVTDGDDILRTQIIDYRVQFFGFGSRWAQKVTFADVILHYARSAHFNVDESVAYWVEYFLDFNDLWYQYSNASIDAVINTLNAHQYFNDERQTFGLFGLTRNAMDQAIKIANRNIDSSVTYEIEFNEFLKSCL